MKSKAVKCIGGFGTISAGALALAGKCPLCWLAMGSAALATYWPILLLPAVAIVVFKLRRQSVCKNHSVLHR